MSAQLLSTSEGATLILTLSNPEHRNALGPEMYAAGVEALSVAESSADIKSVIITGQGGIFSAGGNLQRLNQNRQLPPEHQAQSIEGLHSWVEAIRTFPKPVIAAVEGAAAGAGFSLALAIASRTRRCSSGESPGIMPPRLAGSSRLPSRCRGASPRGWASG
mgnify:CR=1 FL=1